MSIGCIPEREDYRDALISKNHVKLNDLKSGAIVGTSSLRRRCAILAMRPDLEIKWIRGNIDTRLEKLEKEDYDAIVLAAAGLSRMGWAEDIVTEYLEARNLPTSSWPRRTFLLNVEGDDHQLIRTAFEKFSNSETNQTVRSGKILFE